MKSEVYSLISSKSFTFRTNVSSLFTHLIEYWIIEYWIDSSGLGRQTYTFVLSLQLNLSLFPKSPQIIVHFLVQTPERVFSVWVFLSLQDPLSVNPHERTKKKKIKIKQNEILLPSDHILLIVKVRVSSVKNWSSPYILWGIFLLSELLRSWVPFVFHLQRKIE